MFNSSYSCIFIQKVRRVMIKKLLINYKNQSVVLSEFLKKIKQTRANQSFLAQKTKYVGEVPINLLHLQQMILLIYGK